MYCKECSTPMMLVYSRRNGWAEACIKCGDVMKTEAVSNLDQTAAEHAYQGWNYFAVQDFDAAATSFRKAAELSGGWPEYLWAALLAEYGIKYCETERGEGGERYTVNFWKRDHSEKLLAENAEFETVCNAAASEAIEDLRYYRKEAQDVDRGLEQIRRIATDTEEKEYDIFISFKDLDAKGEHTLERKLCDGLYQELTEMGYKVFYSPRAMYGKLVTDYEGYIHMALSTSMLMVLVTSSPENVESPWVKSEWRRFLRWNNGEDYRLLTCTVGDMRVEEYPKELKRVQHELRARKDQLNEIAILKWFSSAIQGRYRELMRKQEKTEKSIVKTKNDAEEQYRLGKQYYEGEGVEQDYTKAVEHLQKAAEQGHAEAEYFLGHCYWIGHGTEKNREKGIDYFRRAAERGNVEAQYQLGGCYEFALGVKEDYKESAKWYQKAAEQGFAIAQYHLGIYYEEGIGVAQDYAEAVKWYRKAAEQGHAVAQRELGDSYSFGEGVAKDYTEAIKWYQKAADQDDVDAQFRIGDIYMNVDEVEDYAQAVRWYRKAAERGHYGAQYCLGTCYEMGLGVEEDREVAIKWYQEAAEQGYAAAQRRLNELLQLRDAEEQFRLGKQSYEGIGVEQDYTWAAGFLQNAARLGHREAEFMMGECYSYGRGVKQDYEEAIKWYREAAEQGYAEAQYELGQCYEKGKGVAKDVEEAIKWYQKASEQGHVEAMYQFGLLQEKQVNQLAKQAKQMYKKWEKKLWS